MKIAIATDAWAPQRNGVVRVLESVIGRLEARGHRVMVASPMDFANVPLPTYREIPIAVLPGPSLARRLDAFAPDCIHIATESAVGHAARAYCRRRGFPFTTAFHTKFPEYFEARAGFGKDWVYALLRRFHRASSAVMVPSPSVYRELVDRGFRNLRQWSHGVDTGVFRPRGKDFLALPRPIFMYVGRVTVEKTIEDFLDAPLPGSKVVVGDGPRRAHLRRHYPDASFLIANNDEELARYYSAADAFVFPSRTDTFGLVMLEALACGVPVAAYPVAGPRDVLAAGGEGTVGVLSENLAEAALRALELDPARCRAYAERFSWEAVTDQFVGFLAPIERDARVGAA